MQEYQDIIKYLDKLSALGWEVRIRKRPDWRGRPYQCIAEHPREGIAARGERERELSMAMESVWESLIKEDEEND